MAQRDYKAILTKGLRRFILASAPKQENIKNDMTDRLFLFLSREQTRQSKFGLSVDIRLLYCSIIFFASRIRIAYNSKNKR